MYTTTQLAVKAGCSRSTVERAINDGDLVAIKPGRAYLIEDTAGDEWAAQFKAYASLRKPRPSRPAAEPVTAADTDLEVYAAQGSRGPRRAPAAP